MLPFCWFKERFFTDNYLRYTDFAVLINLYLRKWVLTVYLFSLIGLVLGLFALVAGADLLVKKSELLARRFCISPFFVGVILLGMGTSAPEWAVSSFSSIKGFSNLAVANILGSNIFNILLVLGLVLFYPLSKAKIQLIKKDILFLVITGFALIPIMWDQFLSRWDAFFLSAIFLTYIIFSALFARRGEEGRTEQEVGRTEQEGQFVDKGIMQNNLLLALSAFSIKEIFFIILGFALLVGGSHLTVTGAVGLGQALGMSERLIGLLIVSVGTSLPELFTCVVAILKNQKDMAMGNIIGSNIFNTFAIFSTAGWIQPAQLDSKILTLDLPALLLVHIALLPIICCYYIKWVQKVLPYVFLSGYIVYLIYLLKPDGF